MNPKFKPEQLALLNDLRDYVAQNAKDKGFKEPPEGIPADTWEKLDHIRMAVYVANQHAETSELWEAARVGTLHQPCDKAEKMVAMGLPALTCAEEEIADMIIRNLDNGAEFKVDIAKAVAVKMAYNAGRPLKHGNKLVLCTPAPSYWLPCSTTSGARSGWSS